MGMACAGPIGVQTSHRRRHVRIVVVTGIFRVHSRDAYLALLPSAFQGLVGLGQHLAVANRDAVRVFTFGDSSFRTEVLLGGDVIMASLTVTLSLHVSLWPYDHSNRV